MNWPYLLFAIFAVWGGREIFQKFRLERLEKELGRARSALGKERARHAARKSEEAKERYDDIRAAHGRFPNDDDKGGNA